MALEALKIVKNWFKNTTTREENWNEIADKIGAYATRTNNNLKQVGLDINGVTYEFNNVGIKTQTTTIVDRLVALEAANFDSVGFRNLSIDTSDTTKIKIVSADGTSLSSTNIGYATFNSTANPGQLITRQITSNIEVTLTGAHWGFDTQGDLTDQRLWVLLIDTGSSVILGVGVRADRETVTTTDDETAVGSVTTEDKVLVDTALSSENSCITIGSVLADFDDTGNAGGENYWTLQTGVGDIELGYQPVNLDGVIYF